MSEPVIELDARASDSGSYDIAIIDGGTVKSGTLRWSSSGASGNVLLPSSGRKWAEEFYWRISGVDHTLQNSDETPDVVDGDQRPAMFKLIDSAAYGFSTAPIITIYDSTSHTSSEEVCVGTTTSNNTPLIKGRIAESDTAPTQYWGESTDEDLHDKDAGAVTPPGNNGLDGDDSYLQAGSTDLDANPQYIWLALSVPDDATTGVDAIDCVFSIKYEYA